MLRRSSHRLLFGLPIAAALFLAAGAPATLHAQTPPPAPTTSAAAPRVDNVILITLDGVRTEEIFGGLDATIFQSTLGEKQKIEDQPLYRQYNAPTPKERREKLMPFFWTTLMREQGSIAGNDATGSRVRLTNRQRFSYPGYAELMLGVAHDDEITSNDKKFYPHETVLEFLKRGLKLSDAQVAVFGSWEVFDNIPRQREGVLTVNAGFMQYDSPTPGMSLLSAAQFNTVPPFSGARYDEYTVRFALDYLSRQKPRLLYIALDETDDWAHNRRYDLVLKTLARTDSYLKELWTMLEGDPQYRGRTAIVLTTDHGRGHTPKDWHDHGAKVEGAQKTWMAFIVPGATARGEWTNAPEIHPNQVAATIARLLGQDFNAASPDTGKPIAEIVK
jgi:Type I phosphodiesterase / nucleotide pyrophosphatase